ncbi:MAG TPA: DnaA N-terminal domain-containing protein, partial [Gammaproteobacteria bacterium]|nr:DnaA N-terminal domain-containing protein [Gammaproteobacteria bacterium]
MSQADFGTWIRPLHAVVDGRQLRLLAPNAYVIEWIRSNCLAEIEDWWSRRFAGADTRVVLEIGDRRA